MAIVEVLNLGKSFLLEASQPTSFKREMLNQIRRGQQQDRSYFQALHDISFNIEKGEIVGLIGPNGAGKSTLLKILSGIYPASCGSWRIDGKIAALLELGTGFCPDLSGRENIFLNASLFGFTNREIAGLLPAILDFSELGGWIEEPLKHYSSGMLMRLGFSIATHLQRDILFVDEIMTVGDMNFQRKCKEKIKTLTESGSTILFSSHIFEDTSELCDRVIYLDHGEIAAIGKPAEVIEAYLHSANQG